MKIIGLTGPSGAGKGFCCGYFESLDIPCLDTDDIYHKLLIPPSACVKELVENFSNIILNEHGGINRKILGEIVFTDKSGKKLDLLNRITHKYVLVETKRMLDKYKNDGKIAVVVDAPLLFEADFDKFCNFSIAVISDKSTRVERIMERDAITKDVALMRIQSQKKDEFYTSRANYTVSNNTDVFSLNRQLESILKKEKIIN